MESRGTGLRPNRPPGWEHGAHIDFAPNGPHGAPQGALKQGEVTSRSMQGVIPGEIGTQLDQSPGGFLGQILMGRPGMEAQHRPGDAAAVGQFGPTGGAMITKTGVQGSTAINRHIGSSKGGF